MSRRRNSDNSLVISLSIQAHRVVLRQPTATYLTFTHTPELLTTTSEHGREAFLSQPSTNVFVQARATALSSLFYLELSVSEHKNTQMNSKKALQNTKQPQSAAGKKQPAHHDYSVGQRPMMRYIQGHDLYPPGISAIRIDRSYHVQYSAIFQDGNGNTVFHWPIGSY